MSVASIDPRGEVTQSGHVRAQRVALSLHVQRRALDQHVVKSRSSSGLLLVIWQAVDLYDWDRNKRSGRYLNVTPLSVTVTLDTALPVAVYEPSTRDTPVNNFTAQTFTQTLGAGMQVLQIG